MEPNEKSRSAKDNGAVSKDQDQFQEDLEWEEWVTKIMNEMDKKHQLKAKKRKYVIQNTK